MRHITMNIPIQCTTASINKTVDTLKATSLDIDVFVNGCWPNKTLRIEIPEGCIEDDSQSLMDITLHIGIIIGQCLK
jgi:hypothetical protein